MESLHDPSQGGYTSKTARTEGSPASSGRNTTGVTRERKWTKDTSLRCTLCRKRKKKCVFSEKDHPCDYCEKTGKECGPKLQSHEDRPNRVQDELENGYWEEVCSFVKERRRRGEGWNNILDILDPDGAIAPVPLHATPNTPSNSEVANPPPALHNQNEFNHYTPPNISAIQFQQPISQYPSLPNATPNSTYPFFIPSTGDYPSQLFQANAHEVHSEESIDPSLVFAQPEQLHPYFQPYLNAITSDNSTEYPNAEGSGHWASL